MPWPVSLAHFDACVNTGVTQAAKFLQRTVGTRDDGLIGPLTLGALRLVLAREAPGALAERLARQRIAFYRELAKRDPEQQVFLQGWLNRVEVLVSQHQQIKSNRTLFVTVKPPVKTGGSPSCPIAKFESLRKSDKCRPSESLPHETDSSKSSKIGSPFLPVDGQVP
jgi:lysozyme family protein